MTNEQYKTTPNLASDCQHLRNTYCGGNIVAVGSSHSNLLATHPNSNLQREKETVSNIYNNQIKNQKPETMSTTHPPFISFPKIPRLFKECVITEKIDGTNGVIQITEDGNFFVGSRNRWLTEESDNHGFCRWAMENKDELMKLGVGKHHGEWWGSGIQRGYGLPKGEKRFSLFNVSVWNPLNAPDCCHVVPTLYVGEFGTAQIESTMDMLKKHGSHAAPFMNPEGIMVYHTAAQQYFKVPFDKNHKG